METALLDQVRRPALLVDLQKVCANITAMRAKAEHNQVLFRPHFKTHQSARIGKIYWERGVRAITVSSVQMAEYFAAAGWKDILIAFPLNWREMDAVNALAEKINLAVLVDCMESAQFLALHAREEIGVWVKIDTGLRRAGIWWEDSRSIEEVAKKIIASPRLTLKGILTHAGQTYHAECAKTAKEIAFASKQAMLSAKEYLRKRGLTNIQVSIGDTPGCRLLDDFAGVDEIRPGNFVFYDLEQWQLGVCQPQEIAVALACPIVSRNRDRKELIIYGGAIHFSKEILSVRGQPIFGMVAGKRNEPFGVLHPDCVLRSTTQEHGVLAMNEEPFAQYRVGDLIQVFPVHSCLAVQALGEYIEIRSGEHIATMVTKKDGCM